VFNYFAFYVIEHYVDDSFRYRRFKSILREKPRFGRRPTEQNGNRSNSKKKAGRSFAPHRRVLRTPEKRRTAGSEVNKTRRELRGFGLRCGCPSRHNYLPKLLLFDQLQTEKKIRVGEPGIESEKQTMTGRPRDPSGFLAILHCPFPCCFEPVRAVVSRRQTAMAQGCPAPPHR